MDILYPYFLTIHLLCAIIFVGYLFCDIVLLSPIRKQLGDSIADKVFGIISKRGTKIMPLCVLLLVITGGAMLSRWVNSTDGFFETSLQQLLVLKVFLASLIVLLIAISLSCHFIFKIKNPVGKIIHPVALTLGIIIAILAKLAFYL